MNTDPNTDPRDFNPEVDEVQGAIDSDPAPVTVSDRTSESSSDFVVTSDGQVTGSSVVGDSRTSPDNEEPREVPQDDAVPLDSRFDDAGQVDQRFDMPKPDVQSDTSQTDAQPAVSDGSLQPAYDSQMGSLDGISQADTQSGAFRSVPALANTNADTEPQPEASQTESPQPINGSQLSASEQDSQSAKPQFDTPQTGPQFDASQAGSQQAGGSQFTSLPGAVPVGVQSQPEVPQFGAQPPASQFGGPQGGQNPIPPMPGAGGQAYPAPVPYPAPNPYMAQNPYVGQPPQMAPPIQQDSGKASGLAIASLILAILFWPIGLIVSIISVCLSSGRKKRTSRILSIVALGISLLIFLFNVIIFVVVLHGTVDFFENHMPDLIDQSQSQTADDNEQDDDEDWESGLQYSEHVAIDPICDLTNGLEFIA